MTAIVLSDRAKGILFFLAAWAVIPIMDACAKALGNMDYPSLMITWGRFAFSIILLLPLLMGRRRNAFSLPPDKGTQTLRALCLVLATTGFYMGLRTLPLADALAIYLIYPFIVTALSALVLGEMPGVRRWVAIAVGFMGSLLIIRPGFDGVPLGTVFILGAAIAFAGYNLLTRRIAGRSDPWQTLVFQAGIGSAVTSMALPFAWRTPELDGLTLFVGMGVAATVGHYLLIRAYDYAPAPVLAPFGYFEIISAAALGYFVFGDFPDALTWAGVAVIVLSGVYIGFRERRLADGAL